MATVLTPSEGTARPGPRVVMCADAAGAVAAAAGVLAGAVAAARAERRQAHLLLGGGRLLRPLCEGLAALAGDGRGVHAWPADEPTGPPGDAPGTGWAIAAGLPGARLHPIAAAGLPRLAAALHASELRRLLPAGSGPAPAADAALAFLEADGSLSALAPCSPALAPGAALCRPVRTGPPPRESITVSLDVLRAARRVVVVAVGADAADAVEAARRGPRRDRPASLLPARRTLLVADRAAARFLRRPGE